MRRDLIRGNRCQSVSLMVGKTKPATKAQKKRMAAIKVTGCICCLLEGVLDRMATVHHILKGGIGSERIGHDATLGLCQWHHKAEGRSGLGLDAMARVWGPSLAMGSKPFVARYGSERLLLEVQDFILDAFESQPWRDYHMPAFMVAQVKEFWTMRAKS